jgi:ribosomal protein S18 acetylase RimI-like enzyme
VPNQLRIEGDWPSPITLSRGWSRASARRWNDEADDVLIKLDRGGVEFLKAVTNEVIDISHAATLSPALYPSATRVWKRCGYSEVQRLEIMERSTTRTAGIERPPVTVAATVDWDRIVAIDKAAFEGFWRMNGDGLREALAVTPTSAMLVAESTDDGGGSTLSGFAIVGAQWNVSYLQRIAVHPEASGAGIGSSLVAAALRWGAGQAASTMVLNVRGENPKARRLYEKAGFSSTGTYLRVLRYDA